MTTRHPRLFSEWRIRNTFRMIESGALKVSINRRCPLSEAAEAHRALEGRRTTGSTILLP